jgi:phosphoadenosine phosphosulfate reductase
MTAVPQQLETVPDLAELSAVARALETQPATAAIEWACDRYGPDVLLAASFQDCVLIDLVQQVAPGLDVAFLDTGYHFAETIWYVDQVRRRYDLPLTIIGPDVPHDDRWLVDPDACCNARKVEPLNRALEGRRAWMSGLRRDDAPSRAKTPIVTLDVARGIVKVNPIATWTQYDVEGYVRERALPVHPLADRGYASIGCWPCTRPIGDGDDPRAGRWAGTDKTECGLHG